MNATYSMDQHQVVTQLGAALTATNLQADAVTISKPKTATTAHYDPLGKDVGSVSNTSYENVTFGSDGKISGGSLGHESISPEGAKLSTTSVGFQSDGKPVSADISIHNLHTDGDFKKVAMDLSGATFNDSFHISSGQVKVTATDPATQAKTHDGLLQFDKETLVSGSFTHYSKDNPGTVEALSELDYSGAKFIGTSIVGGQYTVNLHKPDKTLASSSVVSVSPLGRLQSIQTTNMADASAVKSKVVVDFGNVTFNARNEFEAGNILYTAHNDQGVKMSETTVTYQNSHPSQSQILCYEGDAVQSKIMVDYSQSVFNNKNKVVSSTKKVDIYTGDKLISSAVVAYDANGTKLSTTVPPQPLTPKTLIPISIPKFSMPAAKSATATEQSDQKKRTDGSLERTRVTTLEDGKPVSSLITTYGLDGVTVIKSYTIDLRSAAYDDSSKSVTGSIGMQTFLGGTVLHAGSTIQY